MLKKIWKNVSIVLALAMALSVAEVIPSEAAVETPDNGIYVAIATPYKEVIDLVYVELEAKDLTRSFGIGLPEDGSDGYSGIRALAKAVMKKLILKSEKDSFTDEEYATAEKEMPKYIDYGSNGFLNGISEDGITMNANTARDGKVDPSGYWNVYKDDNPSEVGIGLIDITKITSLDLRWCGATDYSVGWPHNGKFSDVMMYAFVNGKSYGSEGGKLDGGLKVYDQIFNWDDTTGTYKHTAFNPAYKATIEFCDDDTYEVIGTTTADAEGKFKIPTSLPSGRYMIRGTVDLKQTDDTIGEYTYSNMARAKSFIRVARKAPKATSIKVNGKGKSIKVSFKMPKKDSCPGVTDKVQVFVSKKKNSGYKLVKKTAKSSVSFKYAKGTYYVKVRTDRIMDISTELRVKKIHDYSAYSKPVKIKVK